MNKTDKFSLKVMLLTFVTAVVLGGVFSETLSAVDATTQAPISSLGLTINPDDVNYIPNGKTGADLLSNFLGGVYTLVAVIAVLVIVAAGILYIISDGESQKTKVAKDAIFYAVVGLVIVGSAFIITGVVQNIAN